MISKIHDLRKNSKGATLVEYGLAAALVSIAAAATLTSVGQGVNRAFTTVNGKLPAAPAPARAPTPAPAA